MGCLISDDGSRLAGDDPRVAFEVMCGQVSRNDLLYRCFCDTPLLGVRGDGDAIYTPHLLGSAGVKAQRIVVMPQQGSARDRRPDDRADAHDLLITRASCQPQPSSRHWRARSLAQAM